MNGNNLFGSIGFNFPQNSRQLETFNRVYSKYEYKSKEVSVNPERILRRVKQERYQPSRKDYHMRLTLAAEVVFQLQDDKYLGHLKLEKTLYLIKNMGNISVFSNFLKQAMGPYDPVMIRSIDKQFEVNKWFKYNHNSFPKYSSLENVGGHQYWYNRYYGSQIDEINSIISMFRMFNGDQIELVVTIFQCMFELLEDGLELDNSLIIEKVYGWSENKRKFEQEQIVNAITWMLDNKIYPTIN